MCVGGVKCAMIIVCRLGGKPIVRSVADGAGGRRWTCDVFVGWRRLQACGIDVSILNFLLIFFLLLLVLVLLSKEGNSSFTSLTSTEPRRCR